MNSSSSGSTPKQVEAVAFRLRAPFSRRISSNKHAISGGAPTCVTEKRQQLIRIYSYIDENFGCH